MSLSDISIKNPVFAWMLMVAMMLFGFLAYKQMGVSQLPDVDMPMINVSVTWTGASPEVVESDVVDVIESALMGVEGVDSISSSVRRGGANITVEFNLNRNLDSALTDVQSKISSTMRRLPKDMDTPTISKVNPDDQPIMWLAVSAEGLTKKELMTYVRDNIKDKFLTTEGVADIMLSGYLDPNLRVWVDDKKLDQYQLTVNDIINTISSEHSEVPGGKLENGKVEFAVRTIGEAETIDEFSKISINKRGGAPNYNPIKISEVAKVEDGLDDVQRISRVNGKPSIGIGVRKQRGSNAVAVANAVKYKVEEVKLSLPKNMEIGINFDTTKFINESVHELTNTLIISAILTALVCWAFLGSWSATFNVILAIPTSILGSFIVLKALGFTLNYFTLLALSLSIGIVVDDAIMVLENIFRHFEMGKNKRLASFDGAREITFAAMAATVAIIAIFLPIAYMKGVIGKYFYQFGVTISVAVFLSLVEALTLTPMRTSQFMSKSHNRSKFGILIDEWFNAFEKFYARILPYILENRIKVIIISFVLFLGSIFTVPFLRKEFVPAQDQSSIMMRVKAKEGSSLAFTDAKVKDVENYLLKRSEVKRFFVAVGGFGGGESSSATIFVTLKEKSERKLSQQQLMEVFRADLKKEVKGARVTVQDTSLSSFAGGGRGFPIEVAISGSNWNGLIDTIKKSSEELEKTGNFPDLDSNFRESVKELTIEPIREKARARGVAIADIATTINALVGGSVVGKFTDGGHRYDIRLRLDGISADEADLARIKNIGLRNNRGEIIRLKEVANVDFQDALQSINRQDRVRTLKIYSNIKPGYSQASALEEAKAIITKNLTPGTRILDSGSAKTYRESFESLIFVLVLGIVISYMVLGSQFNSFFDPITVLVALPFSVSGAFLALLISNQSINIYSMIGIILLMGIVKKNSILLVDFTNQMRDEGLDMKSAIFEACPKRLRPIIMTSFATIAGAIPAALSIGPGAESLSPMATSVIGGVFVSTFLTLIVVPAIYTLLSPNKREHEKAH
jgi:HAE1 family hydrophobic/amphiphilic exporter-1